MSLISVTLRSSVLSLCSPCTGVSLSIAHFHLYCFCSTHFLSSTPPTSSLLLHPLPLFYSIHFLSSTPPTSSLLLHPLPLFYSTHSLSSLPLHPGSSKRRYRTSQWTTPSPQASTTSRGALAGAPCAVTLTPAWSPPAPPIPEEPPCWPPTLMPLKVRGGTLIRNVKDMELRVV